jgi:hypothetical protein
LSDTSRKAGPASCTIDTLPPIYYGKLLIDPVGEEAMKSKHYLLHRDCTFRRWRERTFFKVLVFVACLAIGIPIAVAFVHPTQSVTDSTLHFGVQDQNWMPNGFSRVTISSSFGPNGRSNRLVSSTRLHFMGSDGGILGIGTPELVRYV